MIAIWRIKKTGEYMSVLVTANVPQFVAMIQSHKGLEFVCITKE